MELTELQKSQVKFQYNVNYFFFKLQENTNHMSFKIGFLLPFPTDWYIALIRWLTT